MDSESLSNLFLQSDFHESNNLSCIANPFRDHDNIFDILDAFECVSEFNTLEDSFNEPCLNLKDVSHENLLVGTSRREDITCGGTICERISTSHFQPCMKICATNSAADTSTCATTHFQPSIRTSNSADVVSACGVTARKTLFSEKKSSIVSSVPTEVENDLGNDSFAPKSKRQKLSSCITTDSSEEGNNGGQQKMAHVAVERNRRKQMNENLSILRSLMPCFYVKRGDQASIIGGVVNYITELQQILQSLQSKKQRKLYTTTTTTTTHELLSPKSSSLSPLKPPLSPRLISPRTPQSSSPYNFKQILQQGPCHLSPSKSMNSGVLDSVVNELVAKCKSDVADVEVKFSGDNVLVQTVSPRIQGQVLKMINVLEKLGFEIMQVNISTVDDTMISCFTIKIGIECGLSAEELAQLIQQTFC